MLQLHGVTAVRALLLAPCETLLCVVLAEIRVVLFCLIYLKFQGQTEIANGILDLHSFSQYRRI